MIKIIAWNIQQGGGSRVLEIVDALVQSKATIICLNEFKNNDKGLKIRTSLLKAGYLHQQVSGAHSNENSVLTASKMAFGGSIFSTPSESYPNNIIQADFGVFKLYNMYLPHRKKHDLFKLLFEEIKTVKNAILVGDFNSGKQYIDQKGNSFMYAEYFDQFEKEDYVDFWRHIHKDRAEFSWFSHQGNGYRYDHIYGHQSLTPIIKSCQYLQEWRLQKWSDHAPMELVLGA